MQGKESEAIETWTNAAIVAGRLGKTPERELLQGKIKTKFLLEGNQEAYSQNSETHCQPDCGIRATGGSLMPEYF